MSSQARLLITYTAKVTGVSYVVGVLCELMFPGMVSGVLSLDFFLWVVILLAVFSYVIHRRT